MTDIERDQRKRRVNEIQAAARRYVRDCAAAGTVLSIVDWGQRRWLRDGAEKLRAIIDAVESEVRSGAAEVARWAVEGKVTRERLGEIFGLDEADIGPFILAWMADDARTRLEQATANLAAKGRFGGLDACSSEIEMMEEATRMVKAVKAKKGAPADD